ncbi:MAG: glycosyltransferase [Patescibacteria group bacterium]
MKKLLILMPALSRGGGERVISELSRGFSEYIDIVIAVFERKRSYSYAGRIIDLQGPLSSRFFDRAFLFFRRLARLRGLLAQEKPDVVMSLGASANLMSIFAAKNPIVRVDMFISAGRKGFFGLVFRLLAKLLFRRAGLVVAVSRAIAQDLEKHYRVPRTKLQTIYNPVDMTAAREKAEEGIPEEYREAFSHPVVITMGRLTKQKGQWHLIRAFSAVKSHIPDAELVILGEGELQEKLEHLAKDLGLGGSAHFLGWQENPFAYLARARLFVLSSLWEGLPDVLLEAMACGLPIVSTDCRSGPREILAPVTEPLFQTKNVEQGKYGILLPVCDGRWREHSESLTVEEHIMADAIVGLLRDEAALAEFKEKSARRAADFDITTIVPQWSFLWKQ